MAAFTATATAVAAPPATATDPTVVSTDSASTTAPASDPGLATTDAVTDTGGASGGAASPAPAADTTVTAAAPVDASAPTPAITDGGTSAAAGGAGAQADIRPQSPVLATGAADTPLAHPVRYAASSSARGIFAPPIVSTSRHAGPPLKATLTQLDSSGPLVASSGGAPATSRVRYDHPGNQLTGPLFSGPHPQRADLIAVSVPLVDVFVGTQAGAPAAARRAGTKALTGRTTGPSGLGSTTVSPFGHGPAGQTGAAAMFGNAPFSSGAGASPLLGLDTMLAAMLFIAAIVWRRRSWDLPLLQGESALFSMVLDRPG